jgi:DegV family protein with EDD domain
VCAGVYQIITDATADMCDDMLVGLPQVDIIPMEVVVGETTYLYGKGGNLSVDEFYALLRKGEYAKTSQICPETYRQVFESYLKDGKDVLYLGFSSGMSGTINSANLCAKELVDEYPERKIICVDTLCASAGEGFIVREALRKQAEGKDMEEVANWVLENRLKVCHRFTISTFQHLLHGGRISAIAAATGTVLNLKPLLRVDEEGKLKVMEKPRGDKQALKAKLAQMEQGWDPGLGKFVIVGHGDSPEQGHILYEEVRKQFPDAKVYMVNIGPIIGAHTGPGMVALVYWGNNR